MGYKVLFADPLGPVGAGILEAEPDIEIVDKRHTPEELVAAIGEYDAMVVRSATTVTAEVIEAAHKLKAIGRAGVGIDNIDVSAATKRGIVVLNAPGGNTLSTAEHAISMLTSLARNIPQAAQSMREGKWEKKLFTGAELHDKTLGVMGLGRIGSEVTKRMQSFNMRVLAFDPVVSPERAKALGVELVPLDQLLREADFVTIHTPLTPETENCIDAAALKTMKPTARIVNCARGGIVNEQDLAEALRDGVVAGAAFDVFVTEPPGEHPLLGLPNFISTPHIGAATAEAQDKVAADVAEQIINALRGRPVATAVNVPAIDPVLFQELQPFLTMAEGLGLFASQYIDGHVREIVVESSGQLGQYDPAPLAIAIAKGFLDHYAEEPANYVNTPVILESRGIALRSSYSDRDIEYSHLISCTIITDRGEQRVAGKLYSRTEARIVGLDSFRTDVLPEGTILVVANHDQPGVIAFLSSLMSEHGINIANMDVARDKPGGTAMTIINIDGDISEKTRQAILANDAIIDAKIVRL